MQILLFGKNHQKIKILIKFYKGLVYHLQLNIYLLKLFLKNFVFAFDRISIASERIREFRAAVIACLAEAEVIKCRANGRLLRTFGNTGFTCAKSLRKISQFYHFQRAFFTLDCLFFHIFGVEHFFHAVFSSVQENQTACQLSCDNIHFTTFAL